MFALDHLEDRLVPSEVVATFNGFGTYRYNDNQYYGPTGWRQLSNVVAQSVAITEQDGSGGYGVVVASFNGYGTYRYRDGNGWQQLNTAAASLVDIDGAYIVAQFPGKGVWEWNPYDKWKQLTSANANSVAVGGDGSVVVSLPGYGVYRHDTWYGSWSQLSNVVANKVAANGSGGAAASFSSYGLYSWQTGQGWRGLTSTVPTTFAINGTGSVAASFTGFGTYLYDGHWTRITTAVTNQIGIEANDNVDYASGGVWLWDAGMGTFTHLTTTNANLVSGGG